MSRADLQEYAQNLIAAAEARQQGQQDRPAASPAPVIPLTSKQRQG
ncbi:hypothetical protein [Microbispora sp. H10949]|nr:hypothetical protein [Microbispora sp. H10949]